MDINRKTAYQVLLDCEKNGAYSNISLNEHISKLDECEPGFIREIVYGVLKNRILLDHILAQLVASGLKKVKKQDLTILRMGVYQLRFMGSVPEYAAVNESVLLAKKFAKGRERFVNGVLRSYLRTKDNISFPNPLTDFEQYLSVNYSVEPWIVSLWNKSYGAGLTEEILRASNRTPDLYIRVNLLKTNTEELKKELEEAGFIVSTTAFSERALLVSGSGLLNHESFKKGKFSVQDIASIIAIDTFSAKAGDVVCDCCAAPGGKTMAISEEMDNRGSVYAMDVYEHKLELIDKTAERLGINIIKTILHDGRNANADMIGVCDKVLCDVPCSGLGVFRRKPELKYKGNDELDELYNRQKEILESASKYVKAGGELMYSTCTINPVENELRIREFMSEHGDFEIITEKQLLPDMGTDGFYFCKMLKKA